MHSALAFAAVLLAAGLSHGKPVPKAQPGVQQAILRNAICGARSMIYDHIIGRCIDPREFPSAWNCAFLEETYDPQTKECSSTKKDVSEAARACRAAGLLYDATLVACYQPHERPSPENCAFIGMSYSESQQTCHKALITQTFSKRSQYSNPLEARGNCYNQAGGSCSDSGSHAVGEILIKLYDESAGKVTEPEDLYLPSDSTVPEALALVLEYLGLDEDKVKLDEYALWSANADNSGLAELTPSTQTLTALGVVSLDSIFLVKGTATPVLPKL